MTDLKTLALAAKAVPLNYKNTTSVETHIAYSVVANPDAILKLLEEIEANKSRIVPAWFEEQVLNITKERDRLREALTETRKRLQEANECGVITDTLWYSQYETLFDFIDAALEGKP